MVPSSPRISADRFAPGMARQLDRFRAALADGMPRLSWKIGINVPEVLRRLDLPHPTPPHRQLPRIALAMIASPGAPADR